MVYLTSISLSFRTVDAVCHLWILSVLASRAWRSSLVCFKVIFGKHCFSFSSFHSCSKAYFTLSYWCGGLRARIDNLRSTSVPLLYFLWCFFDSASAMLIWVQKLLLYRKSVKYIELEPCLSLAPLMSQLLIQMQLLAFFSWFQILLDNLTVVWDYMKTNDPLYQFSL